MKPVYFAIYSCFLDGDFWRINENLSIHKLFGEYCTDGHQGVIVSNADMIKVDLYAEDE